MPSCLSVEHELWINLVCVRFLPSMTPSIHFLRSTVPFVPIVCCWNALKNGCYFIYITLLLLCRRVRATYTLFGGHVSPATSRTRSTFLWTLTQHTHTHASWRNLYVIFICEMKFWAAKTVATAASGSSSGDSTRNSSGQEQNEMIK